jgi:Ethanolamine utilization protein EutJ (predicted chaperonin)
VPEGQALLSGILDACFEVAQDIKAREAEDDVSPTLKPIHDRLAEIKAQLERLRGWQVGSAKS